LNDFMAARSRGGGAATPATTGTLTSPSGPGETGTTAILFDDVAKTITVPRPDGVTVTFVGDDVKIAGWHGAALTVRRQKGGVKRTLEVSVLHPTRNGGSLAGGGEEFLRDGGGLIYDSGMGTAGDMQESKQV
jgi:hypothetical protein